MAQLAQSTIRSQLIALQDSIMILPNVAVAEVVPYSESENIANKPDWYLGDISWRGRVIPLISFEAMCGKSRPQIVKTSRVAVINAVGGHCDVGFYAMLVNGIPRLIQATEQNFSGESCKETGVLSNVQIEGVKAIIPDLDFIEKTLCKSL